MKTCNEVFVRGEPDTAARVYAYAQDIARWPAILPHYRYLRVTAEGAGWRQADFGASRSGFPVRWSARQELFESEARITFLHTAGVTRGMWVEWRITPEHGGARVRIEHALTYPVPVLGPWFADHVVGRLFVSHIAGLTLEEIRGRVEAGA